MGPSYNIIVSSNELQNSELELICRNQLDSYKLQLLPLLIRYPKIVSISHSRTVINLDSTCKMQQIYQQSYKLIIPLKSNSPLLYSTQNRLCHHLACFAQEDLLFAYPYYKTMIIKGRFQILKGYQNNHVTIGFGSYGQVKLARDLQSGQIVAVKIINKIAKNEVMMHYGLSHPKIIKLLDVHIDTQRQITYMILQYAQCGTLFDKIKMSSISRSDIKQYFRDICQGIAYLHGRNIMHRDIKPENVLLNKKNEVKLCDFGFAALLGERMTLCGTYQYMSPEMIHNKPYDYKIDIWALGILLFEMVAGQAPFRGERPEQVLEQMKTKILFCDRFQYEDISLIRSILRVTPHKRPTILEIMDHPFFRVEDKSEQIGNRSTAYSEGTRQGNSTLKYLSQSCNPQQMGQIQKFIDHKLLRETKQDIYPSSYIPKNIQKLGLGLKEVKGVSPQHVNTFMFTKPDNRTQFTFNKPIHLINPHSDNPKNKNSMKSGIYNSGEITSTHQDTGIPLLQSTGSVSFRRFD